MQVFSAFCAIAAEKCRLLKPYRRFARIETPKEKIIPPFHEILSAFHFCVKPFRFCGFVPRLFVFDVRGR